MSPAADRGVPSRTVPVTSEVAVIGELQDPYGLLVAVPVTP
jgi:hypothetical protein